MRLATLAAAGLAAALAAAPAQALTTYDIEGTVVNGPLTGTPFTGSVSFDESLLTNFDIEIINPTDDPDLELLIDILGVALTEEDDTDFPDFPRLRFDDGVLVGIDFLFIGPLGALSAVEFGFFEGELVSAGTSGSVFVTEGFSRSVDEPVGAIPLPGALPLMLGGLAVAGLALRRRA